MFRGGGRTPLLLDDDGVFLLKVLDVEEVGVLGGGLMPDEFVVLLIFNVWTVILSIKESTRS